MGSTVALCKDRGRRAKTVAVKFARELDRAFWLGGEVARTDAGERNAQRLLSWLDLRGGARDLAGAQIAGSIADSAWAVLGRSMIPAKVSRSLGKHVTAPKLREAPRIMGCDHIGCHTSDKKAYSHFSCKTSIHLCRCPRERLLAVKVLESLGRRETGYPAEDNAASFKAQLMPASTSPHQAPRYVPAAPPRLFLELSPCLSPLSPTSSPSLQFPIQYNLSPSLAFIPFTC